MSNDPQYLIEHDTDAERFIAHVPGGGNALLTYTRPAPTVIDVTGTYVPRHVRGQGIAGELMRAAVRYARMQGYRVVPSCSYAHWWFGHHPEELDIVSSH